MKTHIQYLLSVFCIPSLFLSCCDADELGNAGVVQEVSEFRHERPILHTSIKEPMLLRVPFDNDLYAETRDGWPDVRIRDQQGTAVPFLIRPVREADASLTYQREWTADNVSLTPVDENSVEISITLDPDDPTPDGLRFFTPLRDFEHRVQVFDTGVDPPKTLCEDAMIFDYSQIMDVRKTDVELKHGQSRKLKIRVDQLTQDQQSTLTEMTRTFSQNAETGHTEKSMRLRRPFRNDRIGLWARISNTNQTVPMLNVEDIPGLMVTQDADEKQTLVRFDTVRQPISRVSIRTAEKNFSRQVTVQIMAKQSPEQWLDVATGTLARFSVGKLHEESLSLDFPEVRNKNWRLVIFNRDSPPLELQGLTIAVPIYEAVLLATPDHTYSLLYGDDYATLPQQDTEAITRALQADEVPLAAQTGPISIRKVVPTSQSRKPLAFLNQPLFLGALVTILVLVLARCLYTAMQKVQNMPENPREQ